MVCGYVKIYVMIEKVNNMWCNVFYKIVFKYNWNSCFKYCIEYVYNINIYRCLSLVG